MKKHGFNIKNMAVPNIFINFAGFLRKCACTREAKAHIRAQAVSDQQ